MVGYVWEDPGDSIMIQVNLELIERLRTAVQEGLGEGARGKEIGGILFGRQLRGYGRAILIEDFELTPCEHLRGASYTLSPRDKRLLGVRLARRNGRAAVGYFRSHTRPGMYLDQDDFSVFSQFFPDASQVFLLVRPANDGPATGGFFFWEDGEVNRRATYRQFPFDSAALIAGGFPITGGQPTQAPAPRPVPVVAAVPVVAMPAARRTHKVPSLPWIVVPVIAVLFLIAGLFVSENGTPAHEMAVVKTSPPPVESLLPEPAPENAAQAPALPPVAAAPTPETAAIPASPAAAKETAAPALPKHTSRARAPKKPSPMPVAVRPAPVVQAHVHDLAQPPVLVSPAQLESRLATVLPTRASLAPPPEVAVSYEVPRPGVFRRALHKIEGAEGPSGEYAPPAPVRKVSPIRPANMAAGTEPVDVKVLIDEAGHVTRAQLIGKSSEFGNVALTAARQWQFTPARKHHKPVASEMVLHFQF